MWVWHSESSSITSWNLLHQSILWHADKFFGSLLSYMPFPWSVSSIELYLLPLNFFLFSSLVQYHLTVWWYITFYLFAAEEGVSRSAVCPPTQEVVWRQLWPHLPGRSAARFASLHRQHCWWVLFLGRKEFLQSLTLTQKVGFHLALQDKMLF